MMLAGEGPDVSEMYGAFAANWCAAGFLLDLAPYVERDFTADDINDFFPGQWERSVVQLGERAGMRCGIPRYTNVQMQHYHVNLFEAAGLTSPAELWRRGEWNWDTLLDSAKKLTRRIGDEVVQWGYKPREVDNRWEAWVMGAGGDLFDRNDPTRFILGEDRAIEGLEFIRRLYHEEEVVHPEQWGPGFGSGLFGIGDHWGTCCVADLQEEVSGAFEFNMVPVARGPVRHAPLIYDDTFGIWAGTKYPEEAWKFVQFATSPRGMELLAKYRRQMPARRSALHHYVDVIGEGFDFNFILESASAALSTSYPVSGEWGELFQIVEPWVINEIIFGNRPASIAIEEIRPVVEGVFSR